MTLQTTWSESNEDNRRASFWLQTHHFQIHFWKNISAGSNYCSQHTHKHTTHTVCMGLGETVKKADGASAGTCHLILLFDKHRHFPLTWDRQTHTLDHPPVSYPLWLCTNQAGNF